MEERIFKVIELLIANAAWPLTVSLLCFIFRNQIIKILEKLTGSKTFKVSTPVVNIEGEFQISDDIPDVASKIETENLKNEDEIEKPSNWWYADVTIALEGGDEVKAREIFDEYIRMNKDVAIVDSEHSLFLYKLYKHNQSEKTLTEIYKKIESNNIYQDKKHYINIYLMCLDYTGQYKRAIYFLTQEIEKLTDPKVKIELTIRLSKLYLSDLDTINAKKVILDSIDKASNDSLMNYDEQLYNCYIQLAEIEEKQGNKVHEALCLNKALEYNPTSKETLFSSAYASIDSTLEAIQVSNYTQLLNLDPENSAALNNLGVTAGNLGLKGISTNFWYTSQKIGFSLAAVNLGFVLLECGYIRAAEEMANEALKADKPHENVHHLLMQINKEKTSQENKWQEAINYSKKLQKALKKYVHHYYCQRSEIPTSETWIDEYGIEVKLEAKESLFRFDWISESLDISFVSGKTHGTLTGFYSKKKKEGSGTGTMLGLDTKQHSGQCYSYFDSDTNQLIIFSTKINDNIYITLKPKE